MGIIPPFYPGLKRYKSNFCSLNLSQVIAIKGILVRVFIFFHRENHTVHPGGCKWSKKMHFLTSDFVDAMVCPVNHCVNQRTHESHRNLRSINVILC